MQRHRLSIAAVLIVVLVSVVTMLLGIFTVLVYRNEADGQRERLRRELAVNGDQMAAALALPMWNFDESDMRAIVDSGMNDRDIFAIEATTVDRRLLFVRNAQWKAVEAKAVPAGEGLLLEERSVRHGGEVIGQLRMHATPRFLEQDLEAWRRSAFAFIVVLDAGLVLTLTLLLWVLILRPVRALERFAADVQPGESAALPGGALFLGELRELRDSIRRMIAMLDNRYRALRESEERLKLATRSASIGVWDWDVLHNKIVWDDEMHRIFGIQLGQFDGTYEAWNGMISSADTERAHAAVQGALQSRRPFACEFTIHRPDGSTRIVKSEAATRRDDQGRLARMVGVSVDITERRAAEDEIRKLNADLEGRVEERTAQLSTAIDGLIRARDQAESATQAKSEFLANMSHEIRTPMNAVLGMTELALRGDLAPKQRSYLVKAKSAAESLLRIINDILDFSKIEAGKLELERAPFTLDGVLQNVLAVAGLRAHDKGLSLRCDVDAAVPARLMGDALRLEQVLVNLCTNAVKFTERGEVVVSVLRLRETSDSGAMVLRFTVQDTGIGMTPEQMTGLFQPFNQLDASTTRKYGGTGLGLAICRRLVGLMGGEIRATSVPGAGSKFDFTGTFGLVDAAPGDAQPGSRGADEAQAFAALRGRRVLLVEDNDFNQIVAADLLHEVCGVTVVVAGTGPQALAHLEREAFDVVLMDLQMPTMDGYEVTRRIRVDPARAGLPIIAMTAHALATDRARCLSAGMNDFVSKPFDPQGLFGVLLKWIAVGPPEGLPVPAAGGQGGSLSIELGLQRCMGMTHLYEKIVRRFVTARAQTPGQIQAALDAGDRPLAARIAHSLISTAGTLGATDLSETARALQTAIDAHDAERTSTLMAVLDAEHRAACAVLEDYLALLPTVEPATPGLTTRP